MIESYHVTSHPESIYTVTFNSTEKWIWFHQVNDTTYRFAKSEDNEVTIEVPEFLPSEIMFSHFASQDKRQITFIFIPVKTLLAKGERLVVENNPTERTV